MVGILILSGMTAGIAGSDALLSWGMILLSIPLAYTFAFLAREFPSAGGGRVSSVHRREIGHRKVVFITARNPRSIIPTTLVYNTGKTIQRG
ncbi:MAG: hypothetical protein K6T83_20915 [Alicyclobacillus sp.]|nr:hypothetical protein [Alicyclobacillus sp.]